MLVERGGVLGERCVPVKCHPRSSHRSGPRQLLCTSRLISECVCLQRRHKPTESFPAVTADTYTTQLQAGTSKKLSHHRICVV